MKTDHPLLLIVEISACICWLYAMYSKSKLSLWVFIAALIQTIVIVLIAAGYWIAAHFCY